MDSSSLILVYIVLNPTITTKDFEKQNDCLTHDFPISFWCTVSCMSLIYQGRTTMNMLVTVRSNLIIWANHNY